ncbi:MAG: membrane dipeptidase [Armatimonadetes bacterium]|nr:membrane dipeptidase [Armatimonadota bacterium]
MEASTGERTARVHASATVFDGHCDSLACVLRAERSLGERSTSGHTDLPRLRAGGVTAQIFACGLHVFGKRSEQPTQLFLRMADAFHETLQRFPDQVMLATRGSDVVQAKEEGRIAAILGMEDGAPIAGELGILRIFYRLGLRVICLVWGPRNEIGDGVSRRTDAGEGLTPFGVSLVREMNRLGMVVDVSHLNEKGFWDVIEHSEDPIIASHSNARGLYDHPRNLTDRQLRALAERGGVVGVVFTFLHGDPASVTLATVLDHIDYIVDRVGPDHVGIGSDFDGLSSAPPAGLEDATCFPRITCGLLERGHREEDVQRILGGNFLRVFRAVTEHTPA